MLAYVQLRIDGGYEEEILEKLKDLPEVREAHILFGEWDLLLKLRVKNAEELSSFVLGKVRTLPGVKLTSTMIVAR